MPDRREPRRLGVVVGRPSQDGGAVSFLDGAGRVPDGPNRPISLVEFQAPSQKPTKAQ